jgi:hypothetical protein
MAFGNADDRLSKAASAVWCIREQAHMDYQMDGSGELGHEIGQAHNAFEVKAIEEQGFTVQEYNEALRAVFAPEYPHMTYGAYSWLEALEAQTPEEWHNDNTYIDTGGELSSISFLMGA